MGLTDGTMTEVQADELPEGSKVVVAELPSTASSPSDAGGSPFTPQMGA